MSLNLDKEFKKIGDDISKGTNKAGDDIAKGTTKEIKDLQKDIEKIIDKLEDIEKNSNKIIKKIEDFTEKIGDTIYNYAKDKIQAMIIIILIFLLFPHIMALLNFSTNLMVLSKIKKINE